MIDGPRHAVSTLMTCDFVSKDSIASIMTVISHLPVLSVRRIGFVGD